MRTIIAALLLSACAVSLQAGEPAAKAEGAPVVKVMPCPMCSENGQMLEPLFPPSGGVGFMPGRAPRRTDPKTPIPEADKINRTCCVSCQGCGFRIILPSGEARSAATPAQIRVFEARFRLVCAKKALADAESLLKKRQEQLAAQEAELKEAELKEAEKALAPPAPLPAPSKTEAEKPKTPEPK